MSTPQLLDCLERETGPNPTRAVIWLHGLGADGYDFFPIVPELDLTGVPPTRFVFPHANVQPVSINAGMAMRAWYDILVSDIGRQEDEEGIRKSEQLIRALLQREQDRGIESHHIVLAGFSQGCAMTLHTGLRYDRPLAGLIGLSGYLPLADTLEAERHEANLKTLIFMAHGTEDPIVPLSRGYESQQRLEKAGYNVEWRTYGMQHSVCQEEIRDVSRFLRKVLT